ncbi:Uncharacterised protein [Clostridioides difficile]|nr:Uncharacterised protein [Clostridioides difficile]
MDYSIKILIFRVISSILDVTIIKGYNIENKNVEYKKPLK